MPLTDQSNGLRAPFTTHDISVGLTRLAFIGIDKHRWLLAVPVNAGHNLLANLTRSHFP